MPEFKPGDSIIKIPRIEPTEDIKSTPETLEVKEKLQEQQTVLSPEMSNEKKFASLTKRLDNLNNIENVRKELGLTDLKKEDTDIIARQKMKIQEDLTGMKQQTTEIQNNHAKLEENTVTHSKNEEEPASKATAITNEILLDPDKKIESKEVVPFDIKKVYTALENVLTVFNRRAMRLSRFDIIPQQSFDNLVELHNFIQEKIIGKNPDEVGDKVNLDLTNPDEINKEMVEKFYTTMESFQITDPGEWHSLDDQYLGAYRNDMQDMRQVMAEFSQELGPFAEALQQGAYSDGAGAINAAAVKTYNFAGLFDAKVEEARNF